LNPLLPNRVVTSPAVTLAVALAAATAQLGASRAHVREASSPAVEHWARAVLEAAPARALIIASGDHRSGSLSYLLSAAGLRPDVILVNPTMLGTRWYRRDRARELGTDPEALLDGQRLVATGLATRRPVVIAGSDARRELDAPGRMVPCGPALLLLDAEDPEPDAVALWNRMQVLAARYPPLREHEGTWGATLLWDWAASWAALAELLHRAGRPSDAQEAMGRIVLPMQ
jgi:hypothetical protein